MRPSQVIQVVCLPVESLVRNTETSGVVVGWGKTANGQSLDALTGAFTSKQQKLEVYLYYHICTFSLTQNKYF